MPIVVNIIILGSIKKSQFKIPLDASITAIITKHAVTTIFTEDSKESRTMSMDLM